MKPSIRTSRSHYAKPWTLCRKHSAAVALCLGAEFSHEEAAAALGLPLGTVKSHIARGRARLREVLGKEGEDDNA
jgi:RNA polymerase sigma-70 factor (ECF subfamily)